MSLNFNIDEILEMAERIETNGERFYLQAATLVRDKEAKILLQDLAGKEVVHRSIFAGLRRGLSLKEKDEITFDPDGQSEVYLKAMADSHIFSGEGNFFIKDNSQKGIIKTALGFEKDTILFFIGLKEFISLAAGKEKIELIVKEEMGHIRELIKFLERSKDAK